MMKKRFRFASIALNRRGFYRSLRILAPRPGLALSGRGLVALAFLASFCRCLGLALRCLTQRRADLAGAQLQGADLTGAQVQGANRTYANFDHSILAKKSD
jgi:uncharacterized protein YjbI with pentapeptide repeats